MGVDRTYGRVAVEHGDIGEDEPVVVFRARDQLLPHLLRKYWNLASAAGSSQPHLDGIVATRQQVLEWQQVRGRRVEVPGGER